MLKTSQTLSPEALASVTDRYINMLGAHDWWYARSDDYSVYRTGSVVAVQLNHLQKEIDPDYAIWNQHVPNDFKRQRATDPAAPALTVPPVLTDVVKS